MSEKFPGISVHMMVKDPPLSRMAALVEYLRDVAREFVIVDTGSSEDNIASMESWDNPMGTRVIVLHEEFVNFSETRNKGLATHTSEWTLGIDPDEIPSVAMMDHIKKVTSPEGMADYPFAKGWLYWTVNYWAGRLGPSQEYHWHIRLWKTQGAHLYRPVHELLSIGAQPESKTRGTDVVPYAPKSAYLIHAKDALEIERSDQLYGSLGEVSR